MSNVLMDLRAMVWAWRRVCSLTGEADEVYLTTSERREIESRPGFRGWAGDELREVLDLEVAS